MAKIYQDLDEIRAEYRKRWLRHWLILIPLLLILLPFPFIDPNTHALLGVSGFVFDAIAGIVVVGALYYVFANWRCPACNRFLRGEMNVPTCPGCGAQLK